MSTEEPAGETKLTPSEITSHEDVEVVPEVDVVVAAEEKESTKVEEQQSSEGCVLHVSNLTRFWSPSIKSLIYIRNVKNEHLEEIFGHFGPLKKAELRIDPRVKLSKGFAYVEYNSPSDAENAQLHMDGGQLDGNVLKVSFVLVNQRRRRSDSEEKGIAWSLSWSTWRSLSSILKASW
jgi:RNA recognition motif-containing protein